MELAVKAGLSVLTVPSLEDMLAGKVAISQIRQVQLEDLLGREPVQLDDCGLSHWLGDKVVLVTGAGGSIGSELVRQIAQFGPRLLVLLDVSEFALYQIELEFAEHFAAHRLPGRRRQGRQFSRARVLHARAVRRFSRRGLQACTADGRRECLGGGVQ